MSQSPTLLLAVPHLRFGGAAQVTCRLARGLAARGYNVHVASMTDACVPDAAATASLISGVSVHALGARRVRSGSLRLVRLVRKMRPDAILSTMAHLNGMVLLLRPLFPPGTRVLVRHNGVLAATLAGRGQVRVLLFRQLHARADGILCQSEAMAAEFATELGGRARLHVAPNPVDVGGLRAAGRGTSRWTGSGPHLLAIGRLAREKGFDLLLRTFVRVRAEFPSADLAILGSGPEEAALRRFAVQLGLEGDVRFEGQVDDPARWFPGATAFVLPSRHDALPNALLEAAAAGLPLVTTPAMGAAPALLRGQPGAWVAPRIDAPALAETLAAALRTLETNQRFPHAWIENFDESRVLPQYDALIRGCLGNAAS